MVKGPKGTKRERTRRRLVEATLALIAEKGFAAVSVEEIAERAGVSTGSIYSNYKSKADLIWDAAADRSMTVDYRLDPKLGLVAQARPLARAIMALFPQSQASVTFYRDLYLYLQSDPELWARQVRRYGGLFDAIAAGFETLEGEDLLIPARHLALAIQALIRGFIAQWLESPQEVDEDVVTSALEALARGAVATKG